MSTTVRNTNNARQLAAGTLGIPKFRYYDIEVDEARSYAQELGTTCGKLKLQPDMIVIYTAKNGYTSLRKSCHTEEAAQIIATFGASLPTPPANWNKSIIR